MKAKKLFTGFLFCLCLSAPIASLASPVLTTATGTPGGVASLVLKESDSITISGISLTIDYDHTWFTLNQVEAGKGLLSSSPEMFFLPDANSSDMLFASLASDLAISESTDLLDFLFAISPSTPAGSYSVQLTCAFGAGSCDPDYGPSVYGQIIVENPQAVPLPSAFPMMFAGVMGLWLLVPKRRKAFL